MEPNKFSLEHIKNEFLTLTSETSSHEDFIEANFQAKVDKSDKYFEQPEE